MLTKLLPTTLSTITGGAAELTDWYILDGVCRLDDPETPLLFRIVLDLQRWTLVLTEDGELVWIPKQPGITYFLPTEPAEEGSLIFEGRGDERRLVCDRGISPLQPAYDAWREKEAMLQTVHTSIAMGFLDDPGTPPDLR